MCLHLRNQGSEKPVKGAVAENVLILRSSRSGWIIISCLDSHSDGTHSLQSIHCWDTDAETHFYKPDEETKLILISDDLRVSTFSANVIFGVSFPLESLRCGNSSESHDTSSIVLPVKVWRYQELQYVSSRSKKLIWHCFEISWVLSNLLSSRFSFSRTFN